jgi:hypothetical protein
MLSCILSMTMPNRTQLLLIALLASLLTFCIAGSRWIAEASPTDGDLTARRRVFSPVGPGLRAVKRGVDGKYYVLASPGAGVVIFDAQGKQLSVIGAPPPTPVVGKAGRAAIAFGEDCDVDAQGNIYVADRGYNQVSVFSPAGDLLRSFSANTPISVAALPEGEVAVTSLRGSRLVSIFGPTGRVAREFGDFESLSPREDFNRFLSLGRVLSDPQGRLYYGYTYLPEPLVRQFDRAGYAGQDFQFTGLDAFPEAQATRKEIERQEKKENLPPSFHSILTAFGVDPVSGEIWMALHNTLLHFDKDGNRLSEYQIYTKEGARLEANAILVEPDRLLIGCDPLGVFDFERPDRKR